MMNSPSFFDAPLSRHGDRILAACAVWACLVLVATIALPAQENPFDAGGAGAPEEPATESTEETGEASEFDKQVAAETDPLVRSILEAKPVEPQDWIHDARTLLNLQRPVFAKEYLKRFLEAPPEPSEMAAIQSRFGTALFLRLTNTPELQPEGAAVAEAIMRAASDRVKDASRLAALTDRLNDSDSAVRRSALVELSKAGPQAAVPIIAVLGDTQRQKDHAALRHALVALGQEVVDPLIATLYSSDTALRVQAIQLLGKLQAMRAVPDVLVTAVGAEQDAAATQPARQMLTELLGDVPSRDEAIRFLSKRLDQSLKEAAADASEPSERWVWDPAQRVPRLETLSAGDASFLAAALAAQQRHQIEPANDEYTRMYLATGLELAKRLNGYSRPISPDTAIYQEAEGAQAEQLEATLQLALERKFPGAATAAAELLGQTKQVQLLKSPDGKPRLLAQALLSPLPRVKYAAARAVMNIDPGHPYPGSSYLPEVLAYFAATGGTRRVLIGHPRSEDAQQLAGYFQVLGFSADSAPTGRELLLQAFSRPDYSLVLIHDAIDRPPFRDAIQSLRRDPRTADVPIGLMAREVNQERAQWLARTDALTLALAPPQTQQDVAADARRLLAVAPRRHVLSDERMRHATFALDALIQLASDQQKYAFYDLLRLDQQMEQVLSARPLAARAAKLLGLLGTPRAQRALVHFASTVTHPLADRQAAAAGFRAAVDRRGLLLERAALLHQYDIYNASEFLDQDTQQVLASLLDAIEAPSQKASGAGQKD